MYSGNHWPPSTSGWMGRWELSRLDQSTRTWGEAGAAEELEGAGLEAAGEPAPEEEADGTSPLAQPASRRADRANTRHFLIAHSTSPAAESVTGT